MEYDAESSESKALRRCAEQRIESEQVTSEHHDAAAALHELLVHQIELEMQRDELQIAQQGLVASQRDYFELFDLAPVGYVTLSCDDIIVNANKTAASLLGLERSRLVGRPLSAFVLPDDGDEYHLRQRALTATGEPQSWDSRLHRAGADPDHFWAHLESRAERLDEGTPTRLLVTFADITTHTELEQQLREGEARSAMLFENMSEGLGLQEVVLDEHGEPCDYRFLEVNNAFERMTGKTAAEVIGRTVMEVFPETEPTWISALGSVATTGVPAHLESYAAALGGFYDVRAYSPRPGLFMTVTSDITERMEAELALRESEDKFRFIFDHSVVAKSITQPSGEIQVNNEFCEMLGYTAAELGDETTWMQLTHPEDVAKTQTAVDDLISGTAEHARLEKRYIHKNGSVVWVDMSTSLRRDAAGRPLYFITTILDITDRKRDEAALRRSAARLEELLKERERNLERLGASLMSITEVVTRVVEARDPYTAGHERRVSALAERIAEEMGMSAEEAEEIRIAGLVHDVGKISVPAEILSKPGQLTPIEFDLIKCHPETGSTILAAANMSESTVEMVLQHHERCDGSGYPRALSGDELLMGAKVLAVADVVEAMVSHRPYRSGLGEDAALGEIEQGAGRLYDANVAAACIHLFREGGFAFPAVE